jgi:hypothetical protein
MYMSLTGARVVLSVDHAHTVSNNQIISRGLHRSIETQVVGVGGGKRRVVLEGGTGHHLRRRLDFEGREQREDIERCHGITIGVIRVATSRDKVAPWVFLYIVYLEIIGVEIVAFSGIFIKAQTLTTV